MDFQLFTKIQYRRTGSDPIQLEMSVARQRILPAPISNGAGNVFCRMRRQTVVRLLMPVIFMTSAQVSKCVTSITMSQLAVP